MLLLAAMVACGLHRSLGQQDMRARVEAQLEAMGRRPDTEDLSFLPEDSRVTRETDCPGVTEDDVTYILKLEDGLEPDSILIQQVVRNDNEEVTYSARMVGQEWILGTAAVRPSISCLEWDSEALVQVAKAAIKPPTGLPYNFTVPFKELPLSTLEGEVGQPKEVDELVYGGQLKGGFFIEAGSHDAETNSDSLYWEVQHGWSGLLVEAHPLGHAIGLTKQRKASSLQTCLSTTRTPATLHFDPHGSVRNATTREAMAGLVTQPITEGDLTTFEMQCLPLYTVLLALGNPTVHYFSLDIEGAELPVLQTIPWDKIDIRVLSVETHLAGRIFPGDRQDLIAYMDQAGYRHLPWAHRTTNAARSTLGTTDDLFVRKDVPLLKAEPGEEAREEL